MKRIRKAFNFKIIILTVCLVLSVVRGIYSYQDPNNSLRVPIKKGSRAIYVAKCFYKKRLVENFRRELADNPGGADRKTFVNRLTDGEFEFISSHRESRFLPWFLVYKEGHVVIGTRSHGNESVFLCGLLLHLAQAGFFVDLSKAEEQFKKYRFYNASNL